MKTSVKRGIAQAIRRCSALILSLLRDWLLDAQYRQRRTQ